MGQQEYDNFKQSLKDWMDTHPEEYDYFEAEMNGQDALGYQKILHKAIKLVPQYRKALLKKANQGMFSDISDIEELFVDNKLAQSLIDELANADKDTFVPAMLSWLYFGQSFERMVEIGEELRKQSDAGYLKKFAIASTINMLISKSIKLGLRTKANWEEHRKLMQMVDSDNAVDWAIDNATPNEKKKVGRKKTDKSLTEMFSYRVKDNEFLLNKIEEYLQTKHTDQDLALLKIALEELRYIESIEIKPFRDALAQQYGGKIVGERGIQKAYRELNSFIEGRGTFVKDFGKDREVIDGIKA
ncbi:MAG: DUF6043 family protein, partial [Prevotellaceae bacterium]|nr:DUF6043 family protein [Prevotellaceae bacterium]